MTPGEIARIDRLMEGYAGPRVPGAAVAVMREGAVVLARAYGSASLDPARPVTPDTCFRLASMTKQFTARAVALLVEHGGIGFDTPVRSVLPELPPWAGDVRIGHLVAHTAGLPHYEDLIPASATAQLTDRDVLRLVASAPGPRSEPGARFDYDNGGYALLALVAEAVSGVAFGDFLARHIFAPLGMAGAVAHVEGRTVVARRAFGYRVYGDGFLPADQSVTSAVLGDGGIYASVLDLARWDAALGTPGYAPDPAALGPFGQPAGDGVAYGFGWYHDRYRGHDRQRHDGWSCGFQNEIQRFPERRVTVVVLTNRAEPPVRTLAEAIAGDWL